MTEKDEKNSLKSQLVSVVDFKKRRLKIKEKGQKAGIMRALGSFGLIGWTLSVPVILMLIVGRLIVDKFDLNQNWILNFLFIGFAIGIYNSFREIRKEYKKGLKISKEKEEKE